MSDSHEQFDCSRGKWPVSLCAKPRMDSALSLASQHPDILADRANLLNKVTVPIKEYSNRFFRQSRPKMPQNPIKKVNTQRRFNVIFKKKQLLTKNSPQTPTRFQENWIELPVAEPDPMLKVSSAMQIHKEKRVRTENVVAVGKDGKENACESAISEIENELLLSSTILSKLLAPTTTQLLPVKGQNFFEDRPSKSKSRSVSLPKESRSKISQSRGLQLYSKMFVRKESEMMEKLKGQSKPILPKRTIANQIYDFQKNNFETRRIFPIAKAKKGELLEWRPNAKFYSRRGKLSRTVGREEEENFELRGWETTI